MEVSKRKRNSKSSNQNPIFEISHKFKIGDEIIVAQTTDSGGAPVKVKLFRHDDGDMRIQVIENEVDQEMEDVSDQSHEIVFIQPQNLDKFVLCFGKTNPLQMEDCHVGDTVEVRDDVQTPARGKAMQDPFETVCFEPLTHLEIFEIMEGEKSIIVGYCVDEFDEPVFDPTHRYKISESSFSSLRRCLRHCLQSTPGEVTNFRSSSFDITPQKEELQLQVEDSETIDVSSQIMKTVDFRTLMNKSSSTFADIIPGNEKNQEVKVLIKHNPHGIYFELASMTPRANEIADDEPDAKQTWVWNVPNDLLQSRGDHDIAASTGGGSLEFFEDGGGVLDLFEDQYNVKWGSGVDEAEQHIDVPENLNELSGLAGLDFTRKYITDDDQMAMMVERHMRSSSHTRSSGYTSSGEESFDEPIHPPDFAPSMQNALQDEITKLTSRLQRLHIAVDRLHSNQNDTPLQKVFAALPQTYTFESYHKMIEAKVKSGFPFSQIRYSDLRHWGIENAHHRQLVLSEIQEHIDSTSFLVDLFSNLPKTPGFREFLKTFQENRITEDALQIIDCEYLERMGVKSPIHQSILMEQITTFINDRNFLHIFFKQLPQDPSFRFYQMMFQHQQINRVKMKSLTSAQLTEMGIMNPDHRKLILDQTATSIFSPLENFSIEQNHHLSDFESESESTLGSDFMDEIYHKPQHKPSVAPCTELWV